MYIDENGLAEFTTKMKEYIDSKFAPTPQEEYFLTFSSPNSFTLKIYSGQPKWNGTLQTSTDKTNWTTWDGTTTVNSGISGNNNVLYVRGSNNTTLTGNESSSRFKLTGSNISCLGNIETLLDWEVVAGIKSPELNGHPTMTASAYSYLFSECPIITAPELPAITLTNYCYFGMFSKCKALTTAPALPATTLADYCYLYMFRDCELLATAPELPATTMKRQCYEYMFAGCKALTTAPALPATTLAQSCYSNMFNGCISLKFVPELPAIKFYSGCYGGMFNGCTSLYVSDTQTAEAQYAWKIPTNSVISSSTTYTYTDTFKNCLGTRASNNFITTQNTQFTYYTQNQPV